MSLRHATYWQPTYWQPMRHSSAWYEEAKHCSGRLTSIAGTQEAVHSRLEHKAASRLLRCAKTFVQ